MSVFFRRYGENILTKCSKRNELTATYVDCLSNLQVCVANWFVDRCPPLTTVVLSLCPPSNSVISLWWLCKRTQLKPGMFCWWNWRQDWSKTLSHVYSHWRNLTPLPPRRTCMHSWPPILATRPAPLNIADFTILTTYGDLCYIMVPAYLVL